MSYRINWKFIQSLEGCSAKGYVPYDRDGKVQSGVTIGSGFDIGQHSRRQLESFDFSAPLFASLIPYVNAKGTVAKNLLVKYPLTLTEKELEELDSKVKTKYAKQIEQEFNANSQLTFCDLDQYQQTVIASVGFQYGSLKKRCPKFFRLVTSGLWQEAVNELLDFGDAYSTRRKKEAAYLLSSITRMV